MASKNEQPWRPAPRCGAPAAARGGHGGGEAGDQFYDLETASSDDPWGVWWIQIALEAGISVAAEHPLPAKQEARAQERAESFTALALSPAALVPLDAGGLAHAAMAAYQVVAPLLRKLRDENPTPELRRETDEMVRAAEVLNTADRLGRGAAMACRIVWLAAERAVAR